MPVSAGYYSSDDPLALLHRSGWSIGDAAFRGSDGLVWLVTGSNNENMIRAEGATRAEAWHRAVEQAAAVGVLRRRPGTTRPGPGSDN
jgi:hypothetical protein